MNHIVKVIIVIGLCAFWVFHFVFRTSANFDWDKMPKEQEKYLNFVGFFFHIVIALAILLVGTYGTENWIF